MLAVGHRLRHRDEFAAVVKGGRRAGRGCVVVHVLADKPAAESGPARAGAPNSDAPVRVGFVIPRSVGNAVARNLVRRRLRHLMRDRLVAVPAGSDVVVRASAGAAARSYPQLGAELDAALAAAGNNSRDRKVRSGA